MSGPWSDRDVAWVDYDASLQPITVRAPLSRARAVFVLKPAGNPAATTASTSVARAELAPGPVGAFLAATGPCGRAVLAAFARLASGSPLAAPRVGALGLTFMTGSSGTTVTARALAQAVAATFSARPCLAGTGIREVLRLASPLTTQARLSSPVATSVRLASPVEIEQT